MLTLHGRYFKCPLLTICNKHESFKRFRVKNRDNPWFNESISTLIKKRDAAWGKAKKTNNQMDWVNYRTIKNYCTTLVKQTKNKL